ncbi:response regulator transcription factor [Pedobacter mucosus]|uniref:response regulator transcription factor n=1 Tax=Pedobacter mucosus TaxID=2895286 RepID=UPI001EE4D4DE|nr:response regulator [Pedobacter mucosus]UKT65270.1 response regulator [Pedobacter mucosus]
MIFETKAVDVGCIFRDSNQIRYLIIGNMGKRICVLEDNDDIREIISFILEDEAYEVSTYASVKDFLNRQKNVQPDVFLLDVMLPDGNGLDVCNRLKSDSLTKNIPVVIMSANYKEKEVQNQCQAQDFIPKPFDVQDFISRVGIQAWA